MGSLYEEFRDVNSLCITFFLANVLVGVAMGVLVGVQQGAEILPASPGSMGLNAAACVIKGVYALYLTWLRPQVRPRRKGGY